MNIFSRVTSSLHQSRTVGVRARLSVEPSRTPDRDWRNAKLLEAARKHGRPFKCAAENMPREIVLRDGVVRQASPTLR